MFPFGPVAWNQSTAGTEAARPLNEQPLSIPSGYPYSKHARLLCSHSAGGIRAGDLCQIRITHVQVLELHRELYRGLVKSGYLVGLNLIPEGIWDVCRSAHAAQQAFDRTMSQQYTHVITLRGPEDIRSVRALIEREAKPGETVQLTITLQDRDPLSEGLVREILAARGIVTVWGNNAYMNEEFRFAAQRNEQGAYLMPEHRNYNQLTVVFHLAREADPGYFQPRAGTANPEVLKAYYKWIGEMEASVQSRMDVGDGRGPLRFSLGISPTLGTAAVEDMTLEAFSAAYARIMYLDRPNPVAIYKTEAATTARYAAALKQFSTFRVRSADNVTNLSFSVKEGEDERPWFANVGKVNSTPCSLFVDPIESSVNGQVRISRLLRIGAESLQGIDMTFRNGKLVNMSAAKGNVGVLRAVLDRHPSGTQFSEFTIGQNKAMRQVELELGMEFRGRQLAEYGPTFTVTTGHGTLQAGSRIVGPGVEYDFFLNAHTGMTVTGTRPGGAPEIELFQDGAFTKHFLKLAGRGGSKR